MTRLHGATCTATIQRATRKQLYCNYEHESCAGIATCSMAKSNNSRLHNYAYSETKCSVRLC